jgi:hypothetical protein
MITELSFTNFGSPAYSGNAGARPKNLLRSAQLKLRGVL